MVDKPQLDLSMSVAEMLEAWPQVIPVFLRHRMSCVGCDMAAFETVRDAVQIYGIAPETFLCELLEVIGPRA